MANIVRRNNPEPSYGLRSVDPFDMMREMLTWDPFRQMSPVSREAAPGFSAQFDVKETKDSYVFKADLPGIDEKDLEVTLAGNRLTVTGRRESERREENDKYFAVERSHGSFTRTFTLPEDIDAEHIGADLKNGVLTLVVPKKPEAQPKRITFKGGKGNA
jgi:HSP20 family protein